MNLPGKWVLILLLACLSLERLAGQDSRKVKQAKKKAEKKREEQLNQAVNAKNYRIERHFKMQSKEVQERMKASSKRTRMHYSRRKWMYKLQAIFSKPRKNYGR